MYGLNLGDALMARYTKPLLAAITALVLACSGRGHAPEDSYSLYCFQDGLSGLVDYCGGPTLSSSEECLEDEVRINCTAVLDAETENYPDSLEPDRCAPADFIQSICGEIIPCSVASDDTVYLRCGDWH